MGHKRPGLAEGLLSCRVSRVFGKPPVQPRQSNKEAAVLCAYSAPCRSGTSATNEPPKSLLNSRILLETLVYDVLLRPWTEVPLSSQTTPPLCLGSPADLTPGLKHGECSETSREARNASNQRCRDPMQMLQQETRNTTGSSGYNGSCLARGDNSAKPRFEGLRLLFGLFVFRI